MGSKLFGLLVFLVLCVCGYYVYQHFHQEKLNESGDTTCVGCMTPEEKAHFDKVDSGETADGQSEHKDKNSKVIDNPGGFPDTNTTATTVTPVRQTNQVSAPVAQTVAQPVSTSVPPAGIPVNDTLMPNAPNGMAFGGRGTYQWYRQGNLTWRLDTVSGRSCIVFATPEEWQKQIVMAHGCGGNA